VVGESSKVTDMPRTSWLRSEKAHRLFSLSAWIVVGVGVFMTFMLTPWFERIESVRGGVLFLRSLGAPLGILGAPASLILLFGMMAFCVREDRSSTSTKVLWFVLFFVTAFFGAAAYFFMVYRKQIEGAHLLA
jgi:hypothetical protein